MAGPLEGLKVLDLSRVMAGPYATMLLGDYGAEIIKIEDREKGDDTRTWYPPQIEGESAYFLSINRNKKSLTLNLKSNEGKDIFYKLASTADVIVENFRPGVTEKLGIDYPTLSKINKKLIYCSISGFGQTGPYSSLPGYDLVVFAMGGIMSFTGEEGRPPVRVNVPIADISSGIYAVTAILAALNYRSNSGMGQYIDVSMHDVQVSFLTHQAMNTIATGKNPQRTGSVHPNLAPYQAFKGSDSYFVLAAGNDKLWTAFCNEVGRPEWATDSRFVTNPDRMKNRETLTLFLNELFAQRPSSYWVDIARKAGVPAGEIFSVSEVLTDPHVLAREMVTEIVNPRTGKKLKQLGTPVKFSESETSIRLSPPSLGEHTSNILSQLGYSGAEIEDLKKNGVV
jgi:crotonobetainyl-CoA:carnitine CoA-transferase CaiB-like acyl-CoA transferase